MDKEELYDKKIAPLLLEISKKCGEVGLSFVACVSPDGKSIWQTTYLQRDADYNIRLVDFTGNANGNFDQVAIASIRYARKTGAENNSIFLREKEMTRPHAAAIDSQDNLDWQKVRFGETDAAKSALHYYRVRGNPVDDFNMPERTEDQIYSFMAGYSTALANAPQEVDDLEFAKVVMNTMRQSEGTVDFIKRLKGQFAAYPHGLIITAAPSVKIVGE